MPSPPLERTRSAPDRPAGMLENRNLGWKFQLFDYTAEG